nr:glycosyltransferase [Kineosporia babensis]
MFLLRNRLFAEHAGIVPTLVSFDDQVDQERIRATLRAEGKVTEQTQFRNLHESLSTENFPATQEKLSVPGRDYHRPDGSVYLRKSPDGVFLAGPDQRITHRFDSVRALRGWWLSRQFDPGQRVFIISDSRFAVRSLVPLKQNPQVRLIHVVHNIHVTAPYQRDSPIQPSHEPVLEAIPELDALVTLTRRQGEDIAARFATANNLRVIPNPIDGGPTAEPGDRRPLLRFVVLGRLEPQKQIADAVRAFALVVAEEPGARLEIYGEGSQRAELEEQIRAAGLEKSVELRGYDPAAKEELHTATALLLTSRFEGYPLVVLEAMRRGCPVIAYDIAYGPREQVRDGGFLLEPGDTAGLAERMLRLIREPGLVEQLSRAAREQAAEHTVEQYLRQWQALLHHVA